MPCSDSSSSISFKVDHDERFISFEFAKITCGREITADTKFGRYCVGKHIQEFLKIPFENIAHDLNLEKEEEQFILYMEWAALRAAIAQFLGLKDDIYDQDRCQISSIDHGEREIEISLVILPPQELPKILPCSLSEAPQT